MLVKCIPPALQHNYTLHSYQFFCCRHGFLSTRLTFTQLIGFGLALFLQSNNNARLNLLAQGVPGVCVPLKSKSMCVCTRVCPFSPNNKARLDLLAQGVPGVCVCVCMCVRACVHV